MTDQELKDLVASLAISQAKTDEQLKELKASNQRTDERFEDLRASNQRTDERFEDLRASNQRTDERFEDLRTSNKRMGILLGNISNNQGDVAEEFFYNSLEDKKDLAGIHYDFIDKNWKSSTKNLRDEFDIVMVNGKDIAIIEVKYKAHEKDLEKLLTKKQTNFKELFPIYKDYTHHLALASFYMPPELKEKALENNVIVLQRKGDVMETFIPKNP
jgi:Holliday junction resolvase-like predicted endonuclease